MLHGLVCSHCSQWPARDNTVWLLRLKIMGIWEREGYKRLGYLVAGRVSPISLLYILLYNYICNVRGLCTSLFSFCYNTFSSILCFNRRLLAVLPCKVVVCCHIIV